jgi:hypothetical protein
MHDAATLATLSLHHDLISFVAVYFFAPAT